MENRWWEFYFIRYFVGSVLGSLIIMALAFHPDSSLSSVIAKVFNLHDKNLLVLKSEHFLVVLSFGIAFCYLASAPYLLCTHYELISTFKEIQSLALNFGLLY